jgi:zinc protease
MEAPVKHRTLRAAAPGLLLAAAVLAAAPAGAQQTPPPPLPARPIQFPAFTESTLPNGLRVIVVEDHDLPVANLDLYVRSGAGSDPMGKEGVAQLVASLLDKGAGERSARQIAETIEGVGGSISASADDDDISVGVNVLSDQLPLAFELLSDVVLRPTFPADELETVRTQTLSSLRVSLGQPASLATRMFARQVYGERHPYGTAPLPATVQAIARDDVAAFHRAHFVPANALLVVSGDVTAARAQELARRHFGGWTGGAAPADQYPAPPAHERNTVFFVHRPGSVQSNILVGHTGIRPDNPDYWAVQVLNMVLGLTGDSRLEEVLRSQHGWTYSARSQFTRPLGGGYFQANTEVRSEVTDSALAELLVQLRRIRDEAVAPAELEAAKGYLVASFPNRFETPGQVADQLATARLLNLPVQHLQAYQDRVRAVTAADVQRVARQYLNPDRAVIVVVGDATKVLSGVQAIAPVQLFDIEGKPLDAASLQVRASSEAFDGSRLRPVSLTYAVMVQGQAAGTATSVLAREGDGWVERGTLQVGPVNQQSETRFTAGLASTSAKQTMQLPGTTSEVDVRIENGRVRGTAKLPPQAGGDRTFDTEVPAGTRLGGMESWLLAVADLAEGKQITVPVFNPQAGSVSNLTMRVTGAESVTVPAGTFDTFRVEVTGGAQSSTVWVRRDLPHVPIKQEMQGQPVSIELQSMQ